MRNLRRPWAAPLGAGPGLSGAKERPLLQYWQSVIRNRQVAMQLRRRARRLQLLSMLDLAKERVEARARALEAFRTRLQKSIDDPSTTISSYDVREPVETSHEPFDTAIDEPVDLPHEYSYQEYDDEDRPTVVAKKPAKAAKKRSRKRAAKK